MITISRAVQLVWITWGVGWILAAGWSARTRVYQPPRDRLINMVPLLLGAVLLFSRASPDSWLARAFLPFSPALAWGGLAATVAGLLFAVWARVTLGRMWSGRVTLKEDHALVERGPYAIARHPIYTGLVLALIGTAVARDTVLVLIGSGLVLTGLVLKLRQEERLLQGHFGAAYVDYRQRVKGLIPWIW